MTTIEKIKAEIERQKTINKSLLEGQLKEGCLYAFNQVLSFLSTLESEKPMNLDLEIEVEDYVEQRWQFAEDLNAAVPIYLYDMTLNELKDCARHFAEWGAERQKAQTEKRWLEDRDGCFWDGVEEGKKAMKEQMMNEAEPAEIGYFNHRGLSILTEKSIERMPVSEGDKVRIIIVKEDEK